MTRVRKRTQVLIDGRRHILSLAVAVCCLVGPCAPPLLAQDILDIGGAGFTLAVARRQVALLGASRHALAERLLAVAARAGRLTRGRDRTELLGQAQHLADSLALLDEECARADSTLRALRAERDTSGVAEDTARAAHPLAASGTALSGLVRVVADERRRLRTLQSLQDEIRLFMGDLRVLDETAMPPAVRSTGGGGEGAGGCGIPSCPVDLGRPADVPLEYTRPEDALAVDAGLVTAASLARLQEWALSFVENGERPVGETDAGGGGVTREVAFGLGVVSFRGEGGGSTGPSLRAASSLSFDRTLGGGVRLTLEPWAGARSVRLPRGSSAEMAVEARESLTGASGERGPRWQVTSWQKVRSLSDPLPLPGYLEPGRQEGGAMGRVAVPLDVRWAVEVGGGGDIVRYGPADWRALDHRGASLTASLVREGSVGSARLSVLASRHSFPNDGLREDRRVSVGADASTEGRIVLRLSAGVTWNDSRLPAYDYRSERASIVLSAPWGAGSVQAYGALARQRYLDPGSVEVRVAPSTQDAGSVLAVQVTRPWGPSRALRLRAEWSRSETGFANDFYQRFGASAHVALRGLGGG